VKTLRGVVPIVCTPFHDDGRVDFESQRRLVRYLLDGGAHGLGLFGNASEGYTLAADERRQLLEVIVREVDGTVPIVVSSGHTGTDVAASLSREAESGGADALMVLPPYFVKPDAAGLVHYYRAIADAVSIPVMVQDAPLLTGVAMGAPLLARLGCEIPGVAYAKVEAPPTAPKISETVELAGSALALFGGLNGQFVIEEFERGAVGTMPGSDLLPEFVRIWTNLEQGLTDGAFALFTECLPLLRFELQPALGVSAMKHNLCAAGVIASAYVRHPTRSLDARGLQELARLRHRFARRT
jgi:4-hydroxy-tetrahydrodipicolinate synthase